MGNSSEGKVVQRSEERDAREYLKNWDMSNSLSNAAGESTLTPVFSTFNITDFSNHTSGTSTSQSPANRFLSASSFQSVQDIRNSAALAPPIYRYVPNVLPNGRHPLPPSRPNGSIGTTLSVNFNRFIPRSIRHSAAQSDRSARVGGAILSGSRSSNGAPNPINNAPSRIAPLARPSMSSPSTNAPPQAIHNVTASSASSLAGPRFWILRPTDRNTAFMANNNPATTAAGVSTFPILEMMCPIASSAAPNPINLAAPSGLADPFAAVGTTISYMRPDGTMGTLTKIASRADCCRVPPVKLKFPRFGNLQTLAGGPSIPHTTPAPGCQGISPGKRKQDDRDEDEDGTLQDSRGKRRVKVENDGKRKVKLEKTEAQMALPGEEGEVLSETERRLRMKAQEAANKDDKRIAQHWEKQEQLVDSHMPSKEEARKARIEKGINSMSDKEFFVKFGVTRKNLAEKEDKLDEALKMRDQASKEQIAACGIELEPETLLRLEVELEETRVVKKHIITPKKQERRDFFNSLLYTPEIIFELCKFLRLKDFLSLYAISKDVHEVVHGHMSHAMLAAAKAQAPGSARVFPFRLYADTCVEDPTGRPHPRYPDRIRKVPGFKWLQMVVYREKTVRDILALLARQGHRTPKDMPLSMKKMWLLMDIATSAQRVQLLHSKWFTDFDLWNMQLFFVKLDMMFNHPIKGPGHDGLRKLMLGQRSLTPLCKLLKREVGTSKLEISIMSIRYAWEILPEHRGLPAFGVPAEEIGIGHLEGWGKGRVHLIRPDELVMQESVRRGLNLKTHIMSMMLWGYVDPITVKDTPPTEEEMYMSDDAEDPDKRLHWVHPETFQNYVEQDKD